MNETVVLPQEVKQYFWGDNLSDLSWDKHRKYIIQTLLERGDMPALHWLFLVSNKKELKSLLPELVLTKKSANFWRIYLE